MITVNFEGERPLYDQLYDHIRKDIVDGRLARDEKLPSKRNLARHLGISVNTVSAAYGLLLDEGYLYAKERVGYFVSEIENLHPVIRRPSRPPERKSRAYRYDFDLNKNSNFDFPDEHFRRALIESIDEGDILNEQDTEGLYALRRSICDYLRASRGIDAEPENVILSAGMEFLLHILFVLLPKDYTYYLENPGYIDMKRIFTQDGRATRAVEIDEHGVDPDHLKGERGVYLISPTHQFPTGSILRVDRRVKLLNRAIDTDSYIIEDDYDSEYKYYGRPIPAMKSLDQLDRVIYMSNFSKSISPSLRVSFMVVPRHLMTIYREKSPVTVCPIPNIVQLALSKYIDGGYFERRLNKQRTLYDARRKLALSHLGDRDLFEVDDKRAGLHVILTCKLSLDEKTLLAYLKERGINIYGLSDFYDGKYPEKMPKLILGFGNMPIARLEEGLKTLVGLIRELKEKEA